MDPTMKWTGVALVLIAVAGIALWNWAGPASMQSQSPYGMGSPSVQQAPESEQAGYGMGGGMNGMAQGRGGFWSGIWDQMTGWMRGMGMMGGGMHGGMGHGMGGMHGRGMHGRSSAPAPGPEPYAPQAGPQAETGETTVEIANFAFATQELRVRVGQTVTWVNRDGVGHNVVFTDGSVSGPMLGQNGRWSFTFTRPGVYDYYCGPHPFMTGRVVVSE